MYSEIMTAPPRPAVFLDRDGVLNRTYARNGVPHPPAKLNEFELLPGVPEAMQRLAEQFPLIVVTNQPDVARGSQTRQRVEEMNNYLRCRTPVVEVLTCYHDNNDDCPCRKPRPGLLVDAARRWHIDLKRSFMVGDRWSDILAGQAAGCRTVLVDQPYSGAERCFPDSCVPDLGGAADWILAMHQVDETGSPTSFHLRGVKKAG
jgi:D-glycero-D-manno-heptose 1,7-bisphosphate phosphatase